MGLHHATLKAAVTRYGALLASGLTVILLKEEIAKDEKGFTSEEVDEIYEAILAESNQEEGGVRNENTGEENQKATILEAKTPDWVEDLLKSNEAVRQSNQTVIDAVEDFRSIAVGLVKEVVKVTRTGKTEAKEILSKVEPKFNPEANYVVAEGVQFRDRFDHERTHKAGENVDHLDQDVLISLLSRGMIVEEA